MMCPVPSAVCGAAAAERRTGAPDGSCFQYTGNGAAMSHIFLLNNPHFQKEFQKMMAWKRTVFVFSLRFCAFFAAMSKEKVPEKRRKSAGKHRIFRHFSVGKSKPSQESIHVFVHYATILSQSDNKTKDFVHSLRMNRPHSFRHAPQPSVKIFTIAVERGIRPPAAGLRRIIPGSAGHD